MAGDAAQSPPDAPIAVEDDAVTARGQREGASLAERLAAEEPERIAPPRRVAGQVTALDGDQGPDDEPESLGIVEPDAGPGTAEEEALRIDDDTGWIDRGGVGDG